MNTKSDANVKENVISNPAEIYLQPECCADSSIGRLWSEDPAPDECEDGKVWVRYVLADDSCLERTEAMKMIAGSLARGCEKVIEKLPSLYQGDTLDMIWDVTGVDDVLLARLKVDISVFKKPVEVIVEKVGE